MVAVSRMAYLNKLAILIFKSPVMSTCKLLFAPTYTSLPGKPFVSPFNRKATNLASFNFLIRLAFNENANDVSVEVNGLPKRYSVVPAGEYISELEIESIALS
ncbi:MAG: hypothetical protein IPP77_05400 [Bacteroidetes bacterium]|nr:hypothetical protein [Bacteroidota bacterium]